MIAALDIVNISRVGVILLGGLVVGGGSLVLVERARFYRRHNLNDAVRAMKALAMVNALVLAFIAAVLIDRWDEALSWRWVLGALIFLVKGYFFFLLYSTGLEQERRILFGDPAAPRSWTSAPHPEAAGPRA